MTNGATVTALPAISHSVRVHTHAVWRRPGHVPSSGGVMASLSVGECDELVASGRRHRLLAPVATEVDDPLDQRPIGQRLVETVHAEGGSDEHPEAVGVLDYGGQRSLLGLPLPLA